MLLLVLASGAPASRLTVPLSSLRQNRCRNVCSEGACGSGARCEAVNNRAVCSCPQYYRGSGLTGCYAECTAHSECPSHQACSQLRCVDPCAGACGLGAECHVTNHKAICSCPQGYEGHPFDSCRPAQPSECPCTPRDRQRSENRGGSHTQGAREGGPAHSTCSEQTTWNNSAP